MIMMSKILFQKQLLLKYLLLGLARDSHHPVSCITGVYSAERALHTRFLALRVRENKRLFCV